MTPVTGGATVEEIAEDLRRSLPGLSPGDRLPTVRELMARYRVSQFTVQKALSLLKEEGRIASKVGLGTYVTTPGGGTTAELRNVLVLSYERPSDRANELTRLLHQEFLRRKWRSAVLTYAHFEQAADLVASLPRFDACIVQPRGTVVPLNLLAMVRARSRTIAIEGYSVTGIDADVVAIDWREALARALRHLVDLGHRRIGLIVQPLTIRGAAAVADEFRRLAGWSGIETGPELLIELPEGGEETAFGGLHDRLVAAGGGGTAWIAYPPPFHGTRLLRCFSDAGLDVPRDASVVTLGFTDLAPEHVGLWDMAGQSAANVAAAVADVVEKRWSEPDAPWTTRYLRPELIVRRSTPRAGELARPSRAGG